MPPNPAENPFVEFRRRYECNAALFVEEVLGMDGRDKDHCIVKEQRDVLDAVSRGERLISIRSGHGVGKTTTLAWVLVWNIAVRFPQKSVCTAPTSGQLFDALASETVMWMKKLPPALLSLFEIQTDNITLRTAPEESFIAFKTSRPETPEALAGIHCDAGYVLLIADEASGIAEAVFEAASGSMSGGRATTILAGNPVRSSGLFFDTHNKLKFKWTTFHISCVGHPRVSPEFIEDMKQRYGEDSNAYRVRVLGEFPKSDNDAVIPWEWKEAALLRDVKPVQVRPVWGFDCATSGGDRATLAKRRGNVLMEPIKEKVGLDTMQLVGWLKTEFDLTAPSERPEEIDVDSIGLGAGVADRAREVGLPARGINVSESPAMKERFKNLKAELWFAAREWFETRDCNLANDTETGDELVGVWYLPPESSGKLQIEKSDVTRKRLGKSPDRASAFILTFATMATAALYGSKNATSWKEPLRRKIGGVE